MGIGLEDVLAELEALRQTIKYFLECKGASTNELEAELRALEEKLREV